jgi:hypothetical protein
LDNEATPLKTSIFGAVSILTNIIRDSDAVRRLQDQFYAVSAASSLTSTVNEVPANLGK